MVSLLVKIAVFTVAICCTNVSTQGIYVENGEIDYKIAYV